MPENTRREGKAVWSLDEYSAVIPQIQNVYAPERDRREGWCFGLKYSSSVFEFFHCSTEDEARRGHDSLIDAIERFYA